MSLARAITKRYRKNDAPNPSSNLGRTGTVKKYDGFIDRAQISLPIELLSTTNVHLQSAQDLPLPLHDQDKMMHSNLHLLPIASTTRSSSGSTTASSNKSDSDGDRSPGYHSSSSVSTPDTMSIASSPISPATNHLSTYFQMPSTPEAGNGETNIPAVPSRSPSHTKKSHQAMARKRSASQIRSPATPSVAYSMTGPSLAPPHSPESDLRDSVAIFSLSTPHDIALPSAVKEEALTSMHPFGAELAQVNELAEDFASQIAIWDEEEKYLTAHGLHKFGVEEYVMEIEGLYGGFLDFDKSYPAEVAWI
ncbi:hypothetical protein MMC25_000197 [Agyrium rufum]|nr:hypothetical protein [Agyrium rufum]